jgi:SAM-dependent methyltransferase
MYRFPYTSHLTQQEFIQRCSQISFWYHSFYFDNGFEVRGDYNIGADIQDYGFPESMQGMKVLDIGTGSGWFAFYFERLGAEVVTVDVRGYCDLDVYGRYEYPPVSAGGRQPERFVDGEPIYDSRVSGGFWVVKEILGSQVRFKNARAYDINPALFGGEKFDLVFMGALLLHLRDPIGALMAARSVCKGQVIVTTPVTPDEPGPGMPCQYLPYTSLDKISWWLPNESCFRHWFWAAGFQEVDIDRQVTLRCDVEHIENGRVVNPDQILRVGVAKAAE